MKNHFRQWTPLLMATLLALAASADSTTPEDRGLEVAQEVERRDAGFADQSSSIEMILRNRQGEESRRAVRARALEVQGDGDKNLVLFDSPADIKGTAFLSFTHAKSPDDQWLYLPALKRIKRINSVNKSGPFVGSEFAYEDLTSEEVERYTYKYLREETVDGRQMIVIERYPAYEYSGYTRQVVWVDGEIYRPVKIQYYDRKNALLKTLTYHDYKPYRDRFWRPDRMVMLNEQTGKSTTLLWKDYVFQQGMTDRDFDQSRLVEIR
jgi:outer membrane lipoprotein-sorting protein